MPWLASPATLGYFAAQFDEAERSGTLVTFTLNSLGLASSTSFNLIRLDKIGYDFVVRVEDDPSVEGFGAVERALHVLGIDRDIISAGLYPTQITHGIGRIDQPQPRRYAVLADKLRYENRIAEPIDKTLDRGKQPQDNAVLGDKYVEVGANEKLAHSSSPSRGGCGDPTVGDGPVAGAQEEAPATAGTDTPIGIDTSPLVVYRTAALQDAVSRRDAVFVRLRNLAAQPPSEFSYEKLPEIGQELHAEQLRVNRCTEQLDLALAAEVSLGGPGDRPRKFSNRRRPGARFSHPTPPAAPETPDAAQ